MSYQGKAYANKEKYNAANSIATAGKKKTWNSSWAKKAAVVRGSEYRSISCPSDQQAAIFAHVASSKNNLIVEALAGTGKTATCVEAMNKYVPAGKSILYVIFAKRNADEALAKTYEKVDVSTCHAFGLRCIKAAYGKGVEVDGSGSKSQNIVQALVGPEDEKAELRYNLVKAISLAKSYLCEDIKSVVEVCLKHDIEFLTMKDEEFAGKVLAALDLAAQQNMRIDFDDMIWLPIKRNLFVPKFDFVFADESQDLSPARIELAIRAVDPKGKFVGVGDRNQAIFAFTGADEIALDKLTSRLNADILPLHTTYRCGKAIVELARDIVPEYLAHASNADGIVGNKTLAAMMAMPSDGGVGPGDFVISRTNAPLVKQCLELVKQGRKACVLGKDLGKNLAWMVKRSKTESVATFLVWLETWKNNEVARLTAKNAACDHIIDKAETLEVLCTDQYTLTDVLANIDKMFSDEDEGNKVVCLTAHKSKGLEKNRVFILNDTFKCKGSQESNVMYVSITRARSELYFVSGKVIAE